MTQAATTGTVPKDRIDQSTRPYRILLIEDNVVAAKALETLLKQTGHTVEVAHTGQAGIEAARKSKQEVVLCDIGLPDLDGYQVARTLRLEPELKWCVLVAITGYGQEADKRRALEAGFNAHVTKPVDVQELERLLAELDTEQELLLPVPENS